MAKHKILTWLPLGIAAGLVVAACGSDDGGATTGGSCTPTTEVCDGVDNDCDNEVDEALVQDCTSEGQDGTQTCANGTWGLCETTCTPTAEVCDGVDNDCDSAVDEDDEGNALTQTCTTDDGAAGFQYCNVGAWSPCTADCEPQPEVCDGYDNDCDGTADEDDAGDPLKQDCSNDCGLGTEVCANGQWTSCTAPQPSDEVCDGVDNDCDDEIDEGFECAKGEQAECGTDEGLCEFGTKVCGDTCVWGNCIGGVSPGTEACDGVEDEDCDGTVDNGCGCTNGETQDCCGGTTIECTGGTWPSCPPAPEETCNGEDDDCDGQTDEGLPANPYQLDEDISGIDDCEHADTLAAIPEGGGAQSFTRYLYKPDGTEDRDFFLFRADEDEDLSCWVNPLHYECYTVVVSMPTIPDGTDYDFCVYDLGFDASAVTCADAVQKVCASDEAPFDELSVHWEGDCGFSDNRRFIIEVFSADGTSSSCEPYELRIEHLNNESQEEACSF
ncbi:MAG: MopE-related protein [Myxococcota bacterium]